MRRSPTLGAVGRRRGSCIALRAVIGVVDEAVSRPTTGNGHVERRGDELGAHVGGHAPADDAAAPGVGHRGEIAEPGPGRDGRDVGDPEPVGARRMEIAVHEIGRDVSMLIGDRRPDKPAAVDAGDVQGSHEAGDALAGDREARLDEICPDPGHAIRPAAAGMEAADLGGQGGIRELPC